MRRPSHRHRLASSAGSKAGVNISVIYAARDELTYGRSSKLILRDERKHWQIAKSAHFVWPYSMPVVQPPVEWDVRVSVSDERADLTVSKILDVRS